MLQQVEKKVFHRFITAPDLIVVVEGFLFGASGGHCHSRLEEVDVTWSSGADRRCSVSEVIHPLLELARKDVYALGAFFFRVIAFRFVGFGLALLGRRIALVASAGMFITGDASAVVGAFNTITGEVLEVIAVGTFVASVASALSKLSSLAASLWLWLQ